MINKNFNSISQFSVPQEWIDGALSVPQAKKHKKPIVFVTFSRTIAAVASLVIVCSISLLLFFLTNENAVPPVREPDSTSAFTDVSENTATESNNEANSDIIIKPTIKDFINLLDDQTVLPSQNPTSSETTKPSTKPTEDDTEKPNIEPSEDTTDAPTEVPTEYPPQPPYEPQAPTNAPTEMPTAEVPEPTDAPTDEPSMSICSGFVRLDKLTGNGNVYCKLYDSNGNLLGNGNLYSNTYLATKIYSGVSEVYVEYDPIAKGVVGRNGGYFYYYFYNENGEILYSSEIFIFSR